MLFRLFQAFLQQLYHVERYCILYYVKMQGGIDEAQFKFGDTLDAFLFMMIDDQIQDIAGLKKIALGSWFGGTYSVHHIGLYAEQFGKDIYDSAGIAVFDSS